MPRHRPVLYVRPSPQFEDLSIQSRNADRSSLLRSLIQSTSLEEKCRATAPRKATRAEGGLAHSRHYLGLLYRISPRGSGGIDGNANSSEEESESEDVEGSDYDARREMEEAGFVDDCPVFPGLWDLAMLTVGGSVVAAESLISGETSIACWFEGGRHHAASDSAHGFCYLNDVVVACKILLSSPAINRVLYLDIDIHHGDGVESAFLYTDTVVTVSLHLCEPGFYPNTGSEVFATRGSTKTAAIRVPLKRGIDDAMYTKIFIASADALYHHHEIDAIVLQCGVDGLCGDPLGGFNLTGTAYTGCVKHVLSYDKPTLILGGGGYHPANAARIWADVLECCINETRAATSDGSGASVLQTTRDIPLEDDFFERYGPSFSRDIQPQRLKNENSETELQGILQEIQSALKNSRPITETKR